MDALERVGRKPAAFYRECTLYTTLSPCSMCSGAIVLYKIPKVVIGENTSFMGEEKWPESHGVLLEVRHDSQHAFLAVNECERATLHHLGALIDIFTFVPLTPVATQHSHDSSAPVPARTPPRYAPAIPLPPYAYIPGQGLPHPVNDPRGHLYGQKDQPHEPPISPDVLTSFPTEPTSRRRTLAALLAADSRWLYAVDLFNEGFYWESHEAWESFWNALGRTTPEAQFVQGLIHLAAACVKVREGKPNGVARHAKRARELLGDLEAAPDGDALGLAPESVTAVVAELEKYVPSCWHTTPAPVVRVLDESLWLAG